LGVKESLAYLKSLLIVGEARFLERDLRKAKEIMEDFDVPIERVNGLFFRHKKRGEKLLRGILKFYPDDLNALGGLTLLLESEGRCEEAEEEFKRMIILLPQEPWVRLEYANFLRNMGRSEEARVQYQKMVGIDPQEPFCAIEYACFLELEGRNREARKICKKTVLRLTPGDVFRSMLKRKLKEKKKLRELFFDPPSAGTVMRFIRQHNQKTFNIYRKIHRDILEFLTKTYSKDTSKKAGENIDLVGALLKINELKNEVDVDDPDDWLFEECLELIDYLRPGFELFLNKLFFDQKCENCRMKGAMKMGCKEGGFNCVFDVEFKEFEREYIQEIIRKVEEGMKPQEIPELQVPESMVEIKNRIQLWNIN